MDGMDRLDGVINFLDYLMIDKLEEGVYDPGIFKAIFLAGGPGSGKSFIVDRVGTPLVHGMRIVNSDDTFEYLLKKNKISMNLLNLQKNDPVDYERAMVLRKKSKEITARKKATMINGRLGMVIDGTGHEYTKLSKQAEELEQLGYDTYMIFVHTSLDVALERNERRQRKVQKDVAIKSWNDVQQNKDRFATYFGANYSLVDNSTPQHFTPAKEAGEEKSRGFSLKGDYVEWPHPTVLRQIYDKVRTFVKKPIQSQKAKRWIAWEMGKKKGAATWARIQKQARARRG
jgi:cytidylate kinase